MTWSLNCSTPKEAALTFCKQSLREGFKLATLHTYTDEADQALFWRIRLENQQGEKKIFSMHQNTEGRYQLSEPPICKTQLKPLYNLALLKKHPQATVFVVEGEKAADALQGFFETHQASTDYIATTSGSASSAKNAKWQPLKDRSCIIWPDHDEQGSNYAIAVHESLRALNCKIKLLDANVLKLPAKGDVVDWLQAHPLAILKEVLELPAVKTISGGGGSRNSTPTESDQIIAELEALPKIDTKVIEYLATLDVIAFDRAAPLAAKHLNTSINLLNKWVKMIRSQNVTNALFKTIQPYPAPIKPDELLTEIEHLVRRFIVCEPHLATAAALWIAMTWFIDVVKVAPLMMITGPDKRCGKSQLLSVLNRLVYRPLCVANISAPALFRTIELWHPTFLIDEADAFMQRNEELRGIIDAGHTPDAHVVRLVTDTHQPLKFSVWGAKAIAGIGKLESTIMDRSLIFEMRRRLPHEEVEKLRDAEPSLFETLATKLARFRLDYSEAIGSQKPKLPDALNDRAQDNWHPLLSIADVAGGPWPEQARKTALLLSGVTDSNEEEGVGVALLADLRELFTDKKEEARKEYGSIDRITSQEVVAGLCAELEKRWATHNLHHGHDRTITPRQIAMILKNFKIAPRTLNLTGGKGAKGYHFKDFEDAFKRYLPEPSPAAVEAKPL